MNMTFAWNKAKNEIILRQLFGAIDSLDYVVR